MIERSRPDAPEAVALIQLLDAELGLRYPETSKVHGLRAEDNDDPQLIFLVARIDDDVAGCGAIRQLEPGVGEVKRMFVVSTHRGKGIGRQILAALEACAAASGYAVLRLETGTRQPEAISLYRSSGYQEIPPFGEYVGNVRSVCFEKQLV
jgi:GNAT superfamily N-acetyltransferase